MKNSNVDARVKELERTMDNFKFLIEALRQKIESNSIEVEELKDQVELLTEKVF